MCGRFDTAIIRASTNVVSRTLQTDGFSHYREGARLTREVPAVGVRQRGRPLPRRWPPTTRFRNSGKAKPGSVADPGIHEVLATVTLAQHALVLHQHRRPPGYTGAVVGALVPRSCWKLGAAMALHGVWMPVVCSAQRTTTFIIIAVPPFQSLVGAVCSLTIVSTRIVGLGVSLSAPTDQLRTHWRPGFLTEHADTLSPLSTPCQGVSAEFAKIG